MLISSTPSGGCWKGIYAVADTRGLLTGLIEYRDTLTKHVSQLQTEFEHLNREWYHLESVYHGDAAIEFKHLWMNNTAAFQEYIDRSQRILEVLNERITFLQETERSSSS